jgi:hypothetical protein
LAAHPVLFGWLFVLHGYAVLQPIGRLQDLFLYLAGVAGAILILQLVLALLVRHPRKPAILASACVVLFCFMGEWRLQLEVWTQGSRWAWLARMRWWLPVAGTFLFCSWVWVLRTSRTLVTTRRYLDAVSTLLVAVTLVGIFRAPRLLVLPSSELAKAPLSINGHPPDIYFILTDAYTSPESLKAYWDYDDSALVNCLTGLGFHVLKNARSNATSTPVCLATYLNMNYLPIPSDKSMASKVPYCCEIINRAEAPARLKASGYEVRNLSIFDVAGKDPFYRFPGISGPSLSAFLWSRLALAMLLNERVFESFGDVNLKIFSLLPQIAAEGSTQPKFVYAHLMMPHWPYLFDQQGRRIRRGVPPEEAGPEEYLGQLIYENTLITNAVAGILKNSKTPPIIILQGDHGYRNIPGPHRSEEAVTILNALYLPGSEADWLYSGITPVNTFRLIFNHYFGQHYSYLPDVAPTATNPPAGLQDDK